MATPQTLTTRAPMTEARREELGLDTEPFEAPDERVSGPGITEAERRRMRANDRAQSEPFRQAEAEGRRRGRAEASAKRRSAPRPKRPSKWSPRRMGQRTVAPRSVSGAGTSAAEVLLGMVVYALILSVIDYGPTGPLLWFKAKFLNEATGAPGSAPSGGGGGANPPPGFGTPTAPVGPGGTFFGGAPILGAGPAKPPPGFGTPTAPIGPGGTFGGGAPILGGA